MLKVKVENQRPQSASHLLHDETPLRSLLLTSRQNSHFLFSPQIAINGGGCVLRIDPKQVFLCVFFCCCCFGSFCVLPQTSIVTIYRSPSPSSSLPIIITPSSLLIITTITTIYSPCPPIHYISSLFVIIIHAILSFLGE